jgi:hypothetical protein
MFAMYRAVPETKAFLIRCTGNGRCERMDGDDLGQPRTSGRGLRLNGAAPTYGQNIPALRGQLEPAVKSRLACLLALSGATVEEQSSGIIIHCPRTRGLAN